MPTKRQTWDEVREAGRRRAEYVVAGEAVHAAREDHKRTVGRPAEEIKRL